MIQTKYIQRSGQESTTLSSFHDLNKKETKIKMEI